MAAMAAAAAAAAAACCNERKSSPHVQSFQRQQAASASVKHARCRPLLSPQGRSRGVSAHLSMDGRAARKPTGRAGRARSGRRRGALGARHLRWCRVSHMFTHTFSSEENHIKITSLKNMLSITRHEFKFFLELSGIARSRARQRDVDAPRPLPSPHQLPPATPRTRAPGAPGRQPRLPPSAHA